MEASMKKRTIVKVVLVAFGLLVLSSCKMSLDGTVYTSDLVSVAENGGPLVAKATILLDKPTEDDRTKMIELIGKYFNSPSNIRDRTIDYSDYLSVDVQLPIVPTDIQGDGNLFRIVSRKKDNSYEILFSMDKKAFAAMNEEAENVMYQSVAINELAITMLFINDLSSTVRLETKAVYVDDAPKPYSFTKDIVKRDQTTIKLSDVLRDVLSENTAVTLGSMSL
jgi:hypothetical protein